MQAHATARKVETMVRRLIADRTQNEIADAMKVDPAAVSRYLSGTCGVPLASIDGLFDVLGLAVVPRDDLRFLRRMAAQQLFEDDE